MRPLALLLVVCVLATAGGAAWLLLERGPGPDLGSTGSTAAGDRSAEPGGAARPAQPPPSPLPRASPPSGERIVVLGPGAHPPPPSGEPLEPGIRLRIGSSRPGRSPSGEDVLRAVSQVVRVYLKDDSVRRTLVAIGPPPELEHEPDVILDMVFDHWRREGCEPLPFGDAILVVPRPVDPAVDEPALPPER